MDKIKDLTKFLEENFPEGLNDMKVSLEILKELLQKTNDSIAKSMSELMEEKEYNAAREHIDKSEEIMEYIEKLDDIIGLVTISNNEKIKDRKTFDTIKDINIKQEEKNKIKSHKEETKNKKIDKEESIKEDQKTKNIANKVKENKGKDPKKDKDNIIN
ncbi:MAG: hypothetical protein K9K76_02090 [Halanaerobiales bacterium]|nr:hypothetical protein [Halanaerobiales bacterium]